MINRIITNVEIRKLLGISSGKEALIDMWNDIATEMVCNELGVQQLGLHIVTDDRIQVSRGSILYTNGFPANTATMVLKAAYDASAISGFTFKLDAGDIRTVRVYNADGNIQALLPYDNVLATYEAGFITQDAAKIVNNPTDGEKFTVKIAGTTTIYTFKTSAVASTDVEIGANQTVTAANLATKLSGTSVGDTVTLPLGSQIALISVDFADMVIVNANVPLSLKSAIAFIVAGGISEKSKGISSYSIGGKSVTFRDNVEGDAVKSVLSAWLPQYKKINIRAI